MQTHLVDGDQFGAVALDHGERGRVVGHHCARANHGQLADSGKLMDADHCAENGSITDFGVASGHRAVCEHHFAADGGIVADMGPDQDHVVVANGGGAAAERGSAVDCDVLADAIIVANP